MMLKVDELNIPPKVGELYLVLCVDIFVKIAENPNEYIFKRIPVINNLHSDKENGQNQPHYHIDSRFITRKQLRTTPIRIYPHEHSEIKTNYYLRRCIQDSEQYKTHANLIKNSKLKHKCVHKGKCPHRGMDLSQVVPNENGEITCPLHGLKFNKEGKLLNNI